MKLNNLSFRGYKRRPVRRKSGYSVCNEATGGECIVDKSEIIEVDRELSIFIDLETKRLQPLFSNLYAILAFGGYIRDNGNFKIQVKISYIVDRNKECKYYSKDISCTKGIWNRFGDYFKVFFSNNRIENIKLELKFLSETPILIEFFCFNCDVIDYEDYIDNKLLEYFEKKTSIYYPEIFYFKEIKHLSDFCSTVPIRPGSIIVFKSCNRCGRFLPINIYNNRDTLAFSNHCIEKAPCIHPLFSSYKIINIDKIDNSTKEKLKKLECLKIEKDNYYITSFYGHQLECRVCKKFYVNAPLNPLRDSQQFREDGLRRRAFERLINLLLKKNIIHNEFREKKNKEFSEFIYNKFNGRCFKCKKELKSIDEMHLDHTMPLSYLYRLDETATCLCSEHNSQKSNKFPSDYYNEDELSELSKITGLSLEILHSKKPNQVIIDLLIKEVVWFFDTFLAEKEYQEVRDNILTADKIYNALNKILPENIDLIQIYNTKTKNYPTTINVKK